MAHIIFESDVTEYNSIPKSNNEYNRFEISEESMVIKFMNGNNGKTIIESEISIEDAKKLAQLINI